MRVFLQTNPNTAEVNWFQPLHQEKILTPILWRLRHWIFLKIKLFQSEYIIFQKASDPTYQLFECFHWAWNSFRELKHLNGKMFFPISMISEEEWTTKCSFLLRKHLVHSSKMIRFESKVTGSHQWNSTTSTHFVGTYENIYAYCSNPEFHLEKVPISPTRKWQLSENFEGRKIKS